MNNNIRLLSFALLASTAFAQNIATFPADYANVSEGPLSSPNLPLARGTSRVMCLYETVDLDVPNGDQITRLGFREDATSFGVDAGRLLQLEVRMGWTDEDHQSMSTNFDNNYATTPVTVFGPAVFALPDLRDTGNPLPNGQFFLDLTTPFSYAPNGRNLLVEYRVFGTNQGGSQFTYRLDRADYYSPVTYGADGCMHTGGQTANLTVQPTRPGLNYSANVTLGPGNSPAYLAINIGQGLVSPYPLSLAFAGVQASCTGQMDPSNLVLFSGTTNTNGSKNWSFFIPNDPTLAGLTISSQALFLDFFSPGGIVVSNGAEVKTGRLPRSTVLSAGGAPTAVTTGTRQLTYCPVAFFGHQ